MLRTLIGTDLWIDQYGSQAFNLDTVLLANFAKIPYRTKTILDIGTGVGAVMLYLSQKTKAKIIGIEIQRERYIQACKNIEMNHLENQLSCLYGDVKAMRFENIDYIISNPPFFPISETSNLSLSEEEKIAKHEVHLDLDSLVKTASSFLKFGGYFTMIHRPERFEEIVRCYQKYGLIIKRVRFVHPYLNKAANHVLIEAMKQGNLSLNIEPPLILYHDKHIMTEELIQIYGGQNDAAFTTKSQGKT